MGRELREDERKVVEAIHRQNRDGARGNPSKWQEHDAKLRESQRR